MKVVILHSRQGTRLREKTNIRPKAMVEFGTHQILRHINRQDD